MFPSWTAAASEQPVASAAQEPKTEETEVPAASVVPFCGPSCEVCEELAQLLARVL